MLQHVGLRPHPLAGEPAEQLAILERRTALKRLAVAGFGMMQVMMFAVALYIARSSGMDADMREYLRLVSMIVSIPVAIYAGERFVGDGVTGSIPARAHAFVPYAIERSIDVRQSTEQTEDEARATALAGGVLTVELRAVHRARFVVQTSSRPEERLFVFAARAEGFTGRQRGRCACTAAPRLSAR